MVNVIVNGRIYQLAMGRSIYYVTAVRLAGKDRDAKDLTVTFKYKHGRSGSLTHDGGTIPAADGLVINVFDTSNA